MTERPHLIRCPACRQGDGPWSLHHFEPLGCHGTYMGASFILEAPKDGPFQVRRVEPSADDKSLEMIMAPDENQTCAECGHSGNDVHPRRVWGPGSETPLCPECWSKRTD